MFLLVGWLAVVWVVCLLELLIVLLFTFTWFVIFDLFVLELLLVGGIVVWLLTYSLVCVWWLFVSLVCLLESCW